MGSRTKAWKCQSAQVQQRGTTRFGGLANPIANVANISANASKAMGRSGRKAARRRRDYCLCVQLSQPIRSLVFLALFPTPVHCSVHGSVCFFVLIVIIGTALYAMTERGVTMDRKDAMARPASGSLVAPWHRGTVTRRGREGREKRKSPAFRVSLAPRPSGGHGAAARPIWRRVSGQRVVHFNLASASCSSRQRSWPGQTAGQAQRSTTAISQRTLWDRREKPNDRLTCFHRSTALRNPSSGEHKQNPRRKEEWLLTLPSSLGIAPSGVRQP